MREEWSCRVGQGCMSNIMAQHGHVGRRTHGVSFATNQGRAGRGGAVDHCFLASGEVHYPSARNKLLHPLTYQDSSPRHCQRVETSQNDLETL
jgi:hypothetical protein